MVIYVITNYEVKTINNEKVVVLYLDFTLEIGSFDKNQKKGLLSTVKDYLKRIKQGSDYQKVLLMSSGVLVATILYIGNDLKLLPNDCSDLYSKTTNVETLDIPYSHFSGELVLPALPKQEHIRKDIEQEIIEQQSDATNTVETEKLYTNALNNDSEPVNKEEIKTEKKENIVSSSSEIISLEETNDSIKHKTTNGQEDKLKVTIYRSNGSILQIELEEYIVGVVAAEMPASFSSEALKAQAVVARTYALRRISNGEKLTDTVLTQAYIDINQMKTKWGSEFSKYYNKIKMAVEATEGAYITYKGSYINAVYHSTSNGYTEDAINVWNNSYPYLKSVESSWDKNVSSYEKTIMKDYENLLEITGLIVTENLEIKILSRNQSGRVEAVQVGDKIYTGVEFRNLLGLRSTDFDIKIIDNSVKITTRGYGHGVGMSQYGANEMAKQGYKYQDIIKHYYTGVQIKK